MLLQDILKTLRRRKGYTQENIAQKLHISTQAVSKWENGASIPSIDNLLALSDLYGISLDELVNGSPFFKKPYLVGKKHTLKRGLFFVVVWSFISLLFTGFGYQPFWLFFLIFTIGILIVFPTIFTNYWIIENDGIRIKNYSKKIFPKLIQLLSNNQNNEKIKYSEIISAKIVYKTNQRVSPFDFSFDVFYLQISSNDGNYKLDLDVPVKTFLPQFVTFLKRHNIKVDDDKHIIELLLSGKSFNESQKIV